MKHQIKQNQGDPAGLPLQPEQPRRNVVNDRWHRPERRSASVSEARGTRRSEKGRNCGRSRVPELSDELQRRACNFNIRRASEWLLSWRDCRRLRRLGRARLRQHEGTAAAGSKPSSNELLGPIQRRCATPRFGWCDSLPLLRHL